MWLRFREVHVGSPTVSHYYPCLLRDFAVYLHRSEEKVFLVQWRSCLHVSSSDSSKASGFSANGKEQNKKTMNEEGEENDRDGLQLSF